MRNLLITGAALLALSSSSFALAEDTTKAAAGAAVGTTAGAATGGTIGFFLGGPLGAIIGGFAGAAIGGSAAVSATTVEYASKHPVDPVYFNSDLDVGYKVGNEVKVYAVEGDADYGYLYANNRVYIVDNKTHEVVQSPGYIVPQRSVDYVMANPTADVTFKGDLAAGVVLTGDFEFGSIPDDKYFSYVYINGRPVLVDNRSHIVVWVG